MPSPESSVRRDHPLNRGLVSWWLPTPNNSGGQTLFDLVGLNNGAIASGPTWDVKAGRPGVSYQSAGSLTFPFPISSGPFTIEVSFVKTGNGSLQQGGASTTYGNACGWGGNGYSLVSLVADTSSGQCAFFAKPGGTGGVSSVPPGTVSVGSLVHMVGTFDGSQIVGYFNGTAGTPAACGSVVYSSTIYFDRNSYTTWGNCTNLVLNSFRVYNRAASGSEVSGLYEQHLRQYPDLIDRTPKSSVSYFIGNSDLTASFTPQYQPKPKTGGPGGVSADNPVETEHPLNRGLVSWWLPLSGNSGGQTLFDVAPTGRNHAAFSNSPTWGVGPNGFGAVQFNGSNQTATTALNLSAFSQITVSFWLKWTAYSNGYNMAAELTTDAGGTNGGFALSPSSATGGGNWSVYVRGTSATFAERYFTRPSAGDWHHFVFPLDAGATGANAVPAVYVDGQSVTLTTQQGSGAGGNFANSTLYMMSRAASSLFGGGSLTDFRIIGGRLADAAEAYSLYEQSLRGYPDLLRRASSSTWFVSAGGGAALSLTADASAFTYTAQSAGLLRGRRLIADASAFTYTAQSAGILRGRRLIADASSTTVSVQDATFRNTRVVTASASSFAYTAQSAGVLRGRVVTASASSFAVTGQSAGTLRTRIMGASASTFTITGQTATLSTSAGKTVTANVSAFVVTGTAAGLLFGRLVSASASSVAYTAQSAGVLRGRVVAASASALTVAGQDVTFRNTRVVSASASAVTVSGQAAVIARGRILACSASALSYTASAASIYRGRLVSASAASFVVSAQPAALYRSRRTAALASSYSVGGGEATLTYSGDPDGGYATHVLKIPLRG